MLNAFIFLVKALGKEEEEEILGRVKVKGNEKEVEVRQILEELKDQMEAKKVVEEHVGKLEKKEKEVIRRTHSMFQVIGMLFSALCLFAAAYFLVNFAFIEYVFGMVVSFAAIIVFFALFLYFLSRGKKTEQWVKA